MEVVALERGFFDGAPRAIGERFEVPDGAKARWFAPVDSAVAKAKAVDKPKKDKPTSLSELGKEPAKTFVEASKTDLA